MPDGIKVHIFVSRTYLEEAGLWARELQLRCLIELVPVRSGPDLITSPWIQDLVQVRNAGGQSGQCTEITAASGCELAAEIARHLRMQLRTNEAVIAGGNQLVGQQFRLIGASDVVTRSSAGKRADVDVKRWAAIAALDARGFALFGYRVTDLSLSWEPGATEIFPHNGGAQDPKAFVQNCVPRRFAGVHQCGFHVDQFVTITGLFSNGRPLLLVADPVSVDGARDRFNETLKKQLNASALLLLKQGFAVLRNPIPVAVVPDTGKRLARLYNNVLLENACRVGRSSPLVWVPQFTDMEPLEVFDRENLEIWRRLGFEPVPVRGWSHFAGLNGAIRCVVKVLRRDVS